MTMSPKFLNFADVDKKLWRYRHEHGYIATEMLHLLPDGNVGGYDHPNERRWRIENGILSFLGQDGSTTVTFNDAVVRDGRLFLTGRCLPHPEVVLCLQEQGCRVGNNHTKDTLASEIETLGWSIGDHTYGIPTFFEKGLSRLVIGKYCSIATGVKIAFGNHRTDCATSYPFRALSRFWQHVSLDVEDHISKGDVIIGSDVWIGADVFIGSGVKIGSGAVLGAKAVITRDVPPYAVVVGNPGKVVKLRFAQEIVAELLDLKWWDLEDDVVDTMIPLLLSPDVDQLIVSLRKRRANG